MKPVPVVASILLLAAAAGVALWWSGRFEPPPSGDGAETRSTAANPAPPPRTDVPAPGRESPATHPDADRMDESAAARSDGDEELPPPGALEPARHVAWPVTGRARGTGAGANPAGEPEVALELAFGALQYVGVDPEAERTWLRAINDANIPAGARSDLIEDLNQEGYTDNSHPTAADLELILARLELIERLAPYAVDDVNAAAFEEAYKDLLAMYVRLGGEPRTGR